MTGPDDKSLQHPTSDPDVERSLDEAAETARRPHDDEEERRRRQAEADRAERNPRRE